MLCVKYQKEGFVVNQAEEYADYLIIKSALEIEISTFFPALFRQGKKKIYQCSELQQVVNIFRDENACPDDIDAAGQKVLIALYGRKKSEETVDSLIFKLFLKLIVKNNFNLVSLPPPTTAAREPSLRACLQIQLWSGFAKRPLDWCWEETKHGLFSVTTRKEPAPPALLSMIPLLVRKRI
ncbi:hypothetical protein AVEN_177020-1 [Araneus ventricosus]|uniref:Uncharacterized protein n=1 Tax=Araneus ventricosus TaxID=182803 RepID=A0A4Y2VHA0_ARAVE|nr:hypothetical protein AVEN_177020-1 [Araneus ventricosus]